MSTDKKYTDSDLYHYIMVHLGIGFLMAAILSHFMELHTMPFLFGAFLGSAIRYFIYRDKDENGQA